MNKDTGDGRLYSARSQVRLEDKMNFGSTKIYSDEAVRFKARLSIDAPAASRQVGKAELYVGDEMSSEHMESL